MVSVVDRPGIRSGVELVAETSPTLASFCRRLVVYFLGYAHWLSLGRPDRGPHVGIGAADVARCLGDLRLLRQSACSTRGLGLGRDDEAPSTHKVSFLLAA